MKFLCTLGTLLSLMTVVIAKPMSEDMVDKSAAQIDRLLAQELKVAKLRPTGRIDDETFLRRAYLGIVGRIPSADEAREFLDSGSSAKREKLVDELVASPGFDSHLFNWAADLLRLQTKQEQFGLGWHVWLRDSLANDKPWDVLVAEMLKANGHAANDPAVGYYLRDRNMQLDNFSNTMQVFLGQQMGCAQCHDHPFEDWSQYEYYQMAAFGGGIQYQSGDAREMVKRVATDLYKEKKENQSGTANQALGPKDKNFKKHKQAQHRERMNFMRGVGRDMRPLFRSIQKNAIIDNERVQLTLPKDYKYRDAKPGEVVKAETLFGPKIEDISEPERRELFANWVVSRDNPYFTKTITNRLWERTFGYPIMDSLDNLTENTKTAHPRTQAYLDKIMKGVDYDVRQFLRVLYRTNLFQRVCMEQEPTMGEPLVFRGFVLKRMSAEQFYDSYLVLRMGEINDEPATTLVQKWKEYANKVDTLFSSESHQVIMLAESAQQGEKKFRDAQTEMRAVRDKLTQATSKRERQKLYDEMKEVRSRLNQANQQRDPFRSMNMMSMMNRNEQRRRAGQLRISEHSAPMNPGTLVRKFGGSDRQTPSSSNTDASVPQALTLLNNPKTDLITNKGVLSSKMKKMKKPDERLEELFLTLFSMRPNVQEKHRYLTYARDDESLRDLAVAMLTSNRFIFIQ